MNLGSARVEQVHQDTLTRLHAEGIPRSEYSVVNRIKRSADFESVRTQVWSGGFFGHRVVTIRRHLVLIHRRQKILPFTQCQKDFLVVESGVIRGIDHEKTELAGVGA